MNKSGAIGTKAATTVARTLALYGFPDAERRVLHGVRDQGDITGIPGVCIQVKGGDAARDASDRLIEAWLRTVEEQRVNARAHVGFLVVQRRGVGHVNAGRWWAVMSLNTLNGLLGGQRFCVAREGLAVRPVRMQLGDACRLLTYAGYQLGR